MFFRKIISSSGDFSPKKGDNLAFCENRQSNPQNRQSSPENRQSSKKTGNLAQKTGNLAHPQLSIVIGVDRVVQAR